MESGFLKLNGITETETEVFHIQYHDLSAIQREFVVVCHGFAVPFTLFLLL